MKEKNGWENKEEEKWIFDQKESWKTTDNTMQYIKYFTLFFMLFFGLMYFIATSYFNTNKENVLILEVEKNLVGTYESTVKKYKKRIVKIRLNEKDNTKLKFSFFIEGKKCFETEVDDEQDHVHKNNDGGITVHGGFSKPKICEGINFHGDYKKITN